jgi:PAS domain S-box-containing protein
MGEGAVVVDRDFKILRANKSYCNKVKMSCSEIVGRYCYEISHHLSKPCYEAGEECPVKAAFETGYSRRVVHTHLDKENKPTYLEIISYPLKNMAGNITSAIEVFTDVTERVALEEELNKKIKDLEEFYDMAVDRELKMIELKEEIQRLREELENLKKEK